MEKIAQYQRDYGKVVRRIVTEPIELSSSEVRARIANGEDVSHMIPEAVKKYITDNHLYV